MLYFGHNFEKPVNLDTKIESLFLLGSSGLAELCGQTESPVIFYSKPEGFFSPLYTSILEMIKIESIGYDFFPHQFVRRPAHIPEYCKELC